MQRVVILLQLHNQTNGIKDLPSSPKKGLAIVSRIFRILRPPFILILSIFQSSEKRISFQVTRIFILILQLCDNHHAMPQQ